MSLADGIVQQSPAVRRTLAVLLLLATVILAWREVVLPMRKVLTSQNRWRVEVRCALATARGQAAAAPTLQKDLKALADAPIWQLFYPGGDSANTSTAFREDITHYAAIAGVTVRSIVPSPTMEEQSGLGRLGVRISASMTIGQLKDFLTQLRESRHYLRVDALTVIAPQVQITHGNDRLLVQLQILGYTRLPTAQAE